MLRDEGLAGFSVAKVAKSAGVSIAAPYRHFLDRDALLAVTASQLAAKLVAALMTACAQAPPEPIEQLAVTAGVYARFVIETNVGMELLFAERFAGARYHMLHAETRRLMDVLLPLGLHVVDGAPSESTALAGALDVLEAHIAVAHGYGRMQSHGVFASGAFTTEDVAMRAVGAARALAIGRRSLGNGIGDSLRAHSS